MVNGTRTKIEVRRIDICDMMLACLAAKQLSGDGGKKWDKLHAQLKNELLKLDKELGIA